MSKDTLYLIDGTSICYRSFFAIKLSTSKGFPTGAIYGFFQTLKRIIDKYNPQYMGICFDVSRKTFRQEKFKEYKIQRPPLPDGLKAQIPIIKKLIGFLGITLVEKEGFEADDIITSISKKALKLDSETTIVTSDKDIYQLLNKDKIVIYNPNKDKLLNEKSFIEEFGFPPALIIDYLSLTGDSVDNIPGAKGIGKVGAAKLIKSFGTIENIFNNIDKIELKMKKILLDNKENIFLSKELVTLYSCDLDLTWKDLKIKEADYSEIHKLFHELEFKKLLKELPAPLVDLKLNIKKGLSQDTLDEIKKKKELIFFINEDKAYILDDKRNCTYEAKINEAKEVLVDEEIKKISFCLKEQIIHLKNKGIEIKGIWFDVGIAAYLVESSFVDYSLSELASHYLNHFISDISPEAFPHFIGQLYKVLSPNLKKEGLSKLFFKVEMPLIWVLADMQEWGVKIDTTIMKNLLKEVDKELKEVEKKIFKIAGKKFNLNSPKQLRVILFEDLKIPPLKKTKTGYSTGEDVLEKLAPNYPIAKLLLEYRQSNKLKTTYILPLIEDVERKGGKLHAQFNQTSTQTGRLSSSSPNLQSIPTKGKFSSYLRKAFIPSFKEGFLLSADYSQIELRILAHFSEDEHLLEAFKKDLDIHSYTASLLFGIKEKDVIDAQRNLAKKVNFGIVYGMSSFGLSKELNINVDEAQSFIDDYFLRYPKVKSFINKVHKQAEKTGAVKTIMGRRRNLADFNSSNPHLREFARRQAINAPIQGSCADLIKIAMVDLYREFKKRNLGAKIIIQIHDELLFDVPKDELKEVAEIARNYMQKSIKLNVPIKVNIKAGKNWAEIREVK